jgi:hypothetical protein
MAWSELADQGLVQIAGSVVPSAARAAVLLDALRDFRAQPRRPGGCAGADDEHVADDATVGIDQTCPSCR